MDEKIIQALMQKMSLDEIKELRDALNKKPELLEETVTKLENDENEKLMKQEQLKIKAEQDKNDRIQNLINKALMQKSNAERIIGTPANFLNEAFNYLKDINEVANDETIDLENRIRAKLSSYAIEIMFCETFSLLDFYIETEEIAEQFMDTRNFTNESLELLKSQYELLSYEYGKMIGLPDEKIINKTKPDFYRFGETMHQAYSNGQNIKQIFDSFYDVNDNKTNEYCVRNNDGSLSYPHGNMALSYDRYDEFSEIPKEYSEWKNNYHSDGKILEMLIKFLNQYYSSIGFTESSRDEHDIFSSKYVLDGPDDYLPYGKQFKVEFRTNEEKEKFQKLFSLINSKTK